MCRMKTFNSLLEYPVNVFFQFFSSIGKKCCSDTTIRLSWHFLPLNTEISSLTKCQM